MQVNTDNINMVHEIRKLNAAVHEKPALLSVDKEPMDYRLFWNQIDQFSSFLKQTGIKPGDAVATALPEGPEVYVTMFAVSGFAVFAPLNHQLKSAELEEYIERIKPRAIIIQKDTKPEIQDIAKKKGIALIEIITSADQPTGVFLYESKSVVMTDNCRVYDPGTAILLFTSATTGRSKLVPIGHFQIISLLSNVRRSLSISGNGRNLILTPHFHLQNLIAVLIQFFSAGCNIATSGLDIDNFPGWMIKFRPTHFSANPTMLRAIQSKCQNHDRIDLFNSIRYISSAGSAFNGNLVEELEGFFGPPIVDYYGLTETGRISMVPLKREDRRAGSVGKCHDLEVAIVDESGKPLKCFERGEIIVKGDTITPGYIDDPEANEKAFTNGWFHTGDLGYFDDDGFLFLAGRIKEMINRAGEKILPYEIEDVISSHPAVKEVAVFGYPHARMGEDVGACIVLKSHTTKENIREFSQKKLASYKIPRMILFVDEIPKGQTGKPQRTKLAGIFKSKIQALQNTRKKDTHPLNEVEVRIIEIWEKVIGKNNIHRYEDFFIAGGDSLLASSMLTMIENEFGIKIEPEALIMKSTPESLGSLILEMKLNQIDVTESPTGCPDIVIMQPLGDETPFFVFPIASGNLIVYRNLIRSYGVDTPFYGIKLPHPLSVVSNRYIKTLARKYAQQIINIQKSGPYWLIGYSAAGLLAHAVAIQLKKLKKEIGGLLLIDTFMQIEIPFTQNPLNRINHCHNQFIYHINILKEMTVIEQIKYLKSKSIANLKRKFQYNIQNKIIGSMNNEANLKVNNHEPIETDKKILHDQLLLDNFDYGNVKWKIKMPRTAINTLLFWCGNNGDQNQRLIMLNNWKKIIKPGLQIREIQASHRAIINFPYVSAISKEIQTFRRRSSDTAKS